MRKRISGMIALFICASITISGCSRTTPTLSRNLNTKNKSVEYSEVIKNAKEIEIRESLISFGKKYTLYVDGKEVGEVTGKFINVLGDVFTLKDKNGNVLASEKQVKRWHVKFNRNAVIMDERGNVTGYIGEETLTKIFSIGYFFHFFDKNRNEIGTSDQVNISLLKKNIFKDNNGNTAYVVNKELKILTDKYKLHVIDNSKISVYQAVFMVCIEDSIKDAKEKEEKKEKSKKKH